MSESLHKFKYHVLRNVTSPEDKAAGRTRHCGCAPANAFFELPDDDNVRRFLEEEVKTSTRVNDAMRHTLDNSPEKFGILNGGISVVCTDSKIDDAARTAILTKASIINGSQTRGVLRKFYKAAEDDGGSNEYPSVNFELIVTDDEELHAEISIARNYQNTVAPVSVYGRRGLFNDLEAAMQKRDPTLKVRKSETDVGDHVIDTERLIQIITVTVPAEIKMPRPGGEARTYAFSQKAVCLKDYDDIMKADSIYGDARAYFLDVAYDCWVTYNKLRTYDGFSIMREWKTEKLKKRTPVKKQGNKVIDVAQGVLFPIMSALGHFAQKSKKGWEFKVPESFELEDLILQAKITYHPGPGEGDPAKMGKTPACYMALHPVVKGFLKYTAKA